MILYFTSAAVAPLSRSVFSLAIQENKTPPLAPSTNSPKSVLENVLAYLVLVNDAQRVYVISLFCASDSCPSHTPQNT